MSPGKVRTVVDEICDTIGPRASGSEEEAQAARWLEDRLESKGIEGTLESFHVAPSELHAIILLVSGSYIFAYLAYFFSPSLTFWTLTSLVALLVMGRVFGRDYIEAVLPKRWSTNVYGKIKPTDLRKRLVIFAGHHDSAYRMPMLAYRKLYPLYKAAAVTLAFSAIGLWVLSILHLIGFEWSLIRFVAELLTLFLGGLGVLIAGGLVVGGIRTDAVPGANDNLTAVSVAWEVGNRLASTPPKHTEVWLASFGSEELGLKGSRDFVLKHKNELREATVINLESLGQSGKLNVLTGELGAFTQHSEHAISLVEEAAVQAEVHIQRRFLFTGLTDATSFSRQGFSATTLIRMTPDGYLDHYHVPADNPESISEENLEEALKVCMTLVDILDEAGADEILDDTSIS